MSKGTLYLIPNVIAEVTQEKVIPAQTKQILKSISHFAAEDIRTARRYLSSLKIYDSIEPLRFQLLNKDTREAELTEILRPLHEGHHVGVISESGCPGIADPGAQAVAYAHQHSIQVTPLVGPSSVLLALMASGLNGQKFAFHGYLPIDAHDAAKAIKALENESRLKNQTQIFIETPYRNNSLLDHFLKHLQPNTKLSIAVDLTGAEESIKTKEIKAWLSNKPSLPKTPAVFSFLAS